MSKPGLVKNRAAAAIQITAEQLLREAVDRQQNSAPKEPLVRIRDAEEYRLHLADRRKHFEDNVQYRRDDIGNWIKYARFEEQNEELERARSVMERALDSVGSRSHQLFLRYAELELRNECINHARNVLDRAVQLLPRVDLLWYKYVYVEELAGDIPKARAVFQRWMQWQPADKAWLSYAKFEERHGNLDLAEALLRDYVNENPTAHAFGKFAAWAERCGQVPLARTIYEAALQELEPEEMQQAKLFRQFAEMEERQGETERARLIYQHAVKLFGLDQVSRGDENLSKWEVSDRTELYQAYLSFEKKSGDPSAIESVVVAQQRAAFGKRVVADPFDYDGWFEWTSLEQRWGDHDQVRDVYERAVANVPPTQEKQHWKRYIYLWINYAVYEELVCGDLDRASQVYETCLSIIPHKQFSFAKIWILAAQVQVRCKDLPQARHVFGRAIGNCGKESVFMAYIAMEIALGEIDRCRKIYGKYLECFPSLSAAWIAFAGLEQSVGEVNRCRAVYELAVSQGSMDKPEGVWKAYIDFEIDQGEGSKVRELYDRLLEKTNHVKVWISLAQFEATQLGRGMDEARQIFEKANTEMKEDQLVDERVLLMDAWRALEHDKGDAKSLSVIEARIPRRIKRKRMKQDSAGNDVGWEEVFDYQFPEDNDQDAGKFKILELAAKWKESNDNDYDSDLDSD